MSWKDFVFTWTCRHCGEEMDERADACYKCKQPKGSEPEKGKDDAGKN